MQRDENTFTFQQNSNRTSIKPKVGVNTTCNLKRRQSSKSINSKGMIKSIRNHHSNSGSAKNIGEKPNTAAVGLKSGSAGMKKQMVVGLRAANEHST